MGSESSRIENRSINQNKILLVGLAKAGKTSIYLRCFEKADNERIQNLTPTIHFTSHFPKIDFSKENILFVDLGGQKQYIKRHLSDPSQFKNVRTVIFVVDVQTPSNIEDIKDYFSKVMERIRKNIETPVMSVFLHKVDPNQKKTLQNHLITFRKELSGIFPSNITFFETSIFDDSLYEAMIQTLFMSLPKSVIAQTIVKDFLHTAYKTLLPTLRVFDDNPFSDPVQSQNALLDFAIPFGTALGKNLRAKWIKWLVSEESTQESPSDLNEDLSIHFEENGYLIELKCPLSFEFGLKPRMFYCDITHGILKGLATLLGFDTIIPIKTMIRHNTPTCQFRMIRKSH